MSAINPDHYKQGDIECIDAIRAALGDYGFTAFCRGNVMKYVWRAGLKGDPTEDLEKAAWYTNRAAKVYEGIDVDGFDDLPTASPDPTDVAHLERENTVLRERVERLESTFKLLRANILSIKHANTYTLCRDSWLTQIDLALKH